MSMNQQHTPEQNKLEATVFVYRHKVSGKTQAHYIDIAKVLKDDHEWEHLDTLEPRMWIEHHYAAVKQRDELLAALERLKGSFEFGQVAGIEPEGCERALKFVQSAIASAKGGAA